MLAKRIIPCLDVKEGRVVKGVSFLQLRDAGDPVEHAKLYDKEGADELVFLDITASHEKRKIMINVVEKIAKCVFMPFTVGGGIGELSDIRNLLSAGCDKVSINTFAVKNPNFIKKSSNKFGSQCIVLAMDAKRKAGGSAKWEIYINGGRDNTNIDAIEWAKTGASLGAGEILLTSMDYDGTKNGYDVELTKKVCEAVSVPVIASGGCGNLAHIYEVLTDGNADAALAASIFHFREYSVRQAKEYLRDRGVPVRL